MINTIKILALIGLILLVIPSVNATWTNGTLEIDIEAVNSINSPTPNTGYEFQYIFQPNDLSMKVTDAGLAGNIVSMKIEDATVHDNDDWEWENIPQGIGSTFTIRGTSYTGSLMFYKSTVEDKVDIHINFDDNPMVLIENTVYYLDLADWEIFPFYYEQVHVYSSIGFQNNNFGVYVGMIENGINSFSSYSATTDYHYTNTGYFQNNYSIYMNEIIGYTEITRNIPEVDVDFSNSDFILKNTLGTEIYSSGYLSVNDTYNHGNESISIWLKVQANAQEYLLLQNYIEEDIPEENDPLLYTDKSQYNYNDEITFNYTNLDNIHENEIVYDLITYVYDEYSGIKCLTTLTLTGGYGPNEGQAWFSTVNYPYGEIYYSVIDSTLNYHNNKNIIVSNEKIRDSLWVIPEDGSEFIQLTRKQNYYENGDKIYYEYYAKNNVTLNINDSNDNIMYEKLNISGFGKGEYTIPYDNTREFYYPSWSINMNGTEDNFTVYWKEQVVEEYNPEHDPNVNATVEENISTLKEGLQPVKDLIFGFSTILVDNPDYDNNGIVDTEEIGNWLNGIVTIIIVLVIYIFYKGLKRK